VFNLTVDSWEYSWQNPPGCPFGILDPCPWPDDYAALHTYVCGNEADPWRWPNLVIPPNNPSSVSLGNTASVFSASGQFQYLYMRSAINGGELGRNVSVVGDWTKAAAPGAYLLSIGVWDDPSATFQFNSHPELAPVNVLSITSSAFGSGQFTSQVFVVAPVELKYLCLWLKIEPFGATATGPVTLSLSIVDS
jgi:hypothetical protein